MQWHWHGPAQVLRQEIWALVTASLIEQSISFHDSDNTDDLKFIKIIYCHIRNSREGLTEFEKYTKEYSLTLITKLDYSGKTVNIVFCVWFLKSIARISTVEGGSVCFIKHFLKLKLFSWKGCQQNSFQVVCSSSFSSSLAYSGTGIR